MTSTHPPRTRLHPFVQFRDRSRLVHLPALDGLRGAAVVVVVLFHGNWSWVRGGFLGVSLFFTLSGFLITSLLITEYDGTASLSLGSFWARRFRRLLPAAWLTIAVTVVLASALSAFGSQDRGDAIASLLNVANWRFLATGSSYNDLFSTPSPFRHFWSLAIEEQAYVALPVLVWVALRVSRGSLSVLASVLGVLLSLSMWTTLTADSVDRVYYGTITRSAEILIGALLAAMVAHPKTRVHLLRRWVLRSVVVVAGVVSLVGFLVACVRVEVGSAFVLKGGLVLIAVGSAALILNAAMGIGIIGFIFEWRPLRWLGGISYGVYLFHWPLFALLTERRTGLGHFPRFVVLVALTLVLAVLSSRHVEIPMRRRRFPKPALPTMASAAAVIVVVLALIMPTTTSLVFDAEAASAQLDTLVMGSLPAATSGESGTSADGSPGEGLSELAAAQAQREAERAPAIMHFGDSVALSMAFPLAAWAVETQGGFFLGGDTTIGCGIGRGGYERSFGVVPRRAECDNWPQRWYPITDVDGLDIAMVHTGQWELVDRRIPLGMNHTVVGEDAALLSTPVPTQIDEVWRNVGDPIYDDYLLAELSAAQELLSRRGALVLWVNLPYYSNLDSESFNANLRLSHDPARVDAFNAVLERLTAKFPDTSRLLDLHTYMADKTDDTSLRADGSHFNKEGAESVALEFLGPELLRLWRDWRAPQLGLDGDR